MRYGPTLAMKLGFCRYADVYLFSAMIDGRQLGSTCGPRRSSCTAEQAGHQRRFERPLGMSAMPPIATKSLHRGNRRFGPIVLQKSLKPERDFLG